MKIVTQQEFLALPSGTVFSEYTPAYFEGLYIKGDSISDGAGNFIDFFKESLIGNIMSQGTIDWEEKVEQMESQGAEHPLWFGKISRDGSFDAQQLYGIYDQRDLASLITRLQQSLMPPSAQ